MAILRRSLMTVLAVVVSCLVVPQPAQAQAYPAEPLRWIVGYSPGGGSDVIARLIAQHLSARLGQAIIIDNRPGAGGILGAQAIARSVPDGYTMGSSGNGELAINQFLYKNLPYESGDFLPVSTTGKFPLLLVVNPSGAVHSVKEFIEYARANPGKVNYGSPGIGSPHHLAMEYFKQGAGIDATHVPYKGAAPAVQALLSGEIDAMFLDLTSAQAHVRAGKMKALAASTKDRLAALPDLPTIQELGIPGFDVFAWQAVVLPKGTPLSVVNRLNEEIVAVLNSEDIRKRFDEMGIVPMPMRSSEMAQLIAADQQKWGEVLRSLNINLD